MLEHENLTVKIEGFFQTCQHNNYKKQFLLLACCCGKFHCFFERDFLLTSCRLQTLFDTGLKHTTTDCPTAQILNAVIYLKQQLRPKEHRHSTTIVLD